MTALMEDYFALSTKLLKRDLERVRRKEPVEGEYLNFVHNGRSGALDYSIEQSFDGNDYLVVQVGEDPQKILLAKRELTFGTRFYLSCGCGRKTNALYLKSSYFACRKCQKLHYKSTRLNIKTDYGQLLFQQDRKLKLIEMREKIDRPVYRGRFTKRFIRWLGLCSRAGIFNEAMQAWGNMEAMRNKRTQ